MKKSILLILVAVFLLNFTGQAQTKKTKPESKPPTGKGSFADVGGKTYNLFGIGSTRQSNIIWHLQIGSLKETNLILDAKNAAFAY